MYRWTYTQIKFAVPAILFIFLYRKSNGDVTSLRMIRVSKLHGLHLRLMHVICTQFCNEQHYFALLLCRGSCHESLYLYPADFFMCCERNLHSCWNTSKLSCYTKFKRIITFNSAINCLFSWRVSHTLSKIVFKFYYIELNSSLQLIKPLQSSKTIVT